MSPTRCDDDRRADAGRIDRERKLQVNPAKIARIPTEVEMILPVEKNNSTTFTMHAFVLIQAHA